MSVHKRVGVHEKVNVYRKWVAWPVLLPIFVTGCTTTRPAMPGPICAPVGTVPGQPDWWVVLCYAPETVPRPLPPAETEES